MSSVPSPRVHPTAGPAVPRGPRRASWELRFSLTQFLLLSGICAGGMISSYYLGFASGKSVGVEAALDGSVASLPKLPIVPPLDSGLADANNGNDVLAKLDTDRLGAPNSDISLKKDSEALKAIPEVRLEPATGSNSDGTASGLGRNRDGGDGASIDASKPQDALEKVLDETSSAIGRVAATAASAQAQQKEAPGIAADKLDLQLVRSEAVPKGWYVQAAAATTVDDSRAVAGRLHASGFPVVIEDVKVGKKQYYRVLVGPEADKGPAKQMVDQVKREKFVKGEPFLRRVN